MANITKIQLQSIENSANWYPITNVDCVEGLKDWLDSNKYLTDSALNNYVTSESLETTLEDYVLTSDLTTELAKKADKSEIPSLEGYATESWVKGQNYLTEHQSLTDYAKTSEVESKIAAAITESEKKIFGEGELQQAFDTIKEIGDYLNTHDGAYKNLLATVNGKLDASVYNTDKETFATKTWVEEKNYLTSHQSLDDYYTKSQVYTKAEVDGLLQNFDLSAYYTKTEVDDEIKKAIDELKKTIGVKATLMD